MIEPERLCLPPAFELYKLVMLAGAKLFYLSGMKNGKYMKREVLNLARFISVMKFRPLNWRMAHPYLLTDRLEVLHVLQQPGFELHVSASDCT